MRSHPFRASALAAIIAATAGVARAQNTPAAPLVLRLPASARALGMGDVNIASTNDDVLFYNPAQLATARGTSLSMQQFEEGVGGALSSSIAFNGTNGGVGIGAQWVSFYSATALPFSPNSVDVRGGPSASSAAVTLGFAHVVKGIRFGIGAKVSQETSGTERSNQLLGDVGASKDLRFLTLGLAFRNLGAATETSGGGAEVSPPSRVTLGMAFGRPLAVWFPSLPFLDLGIVGETSVLRDGWIKPAMGLELSYNWIDGYALLLRGGVRRPELGERYATMGAGFVADRLRFDYALEPRDGGTLSHRFGLRVR